MDNLKDIITASFQNQIELYERREGLYQLILPVFHEDGDMLDIFIQKSPCNNLIRIEDAGLTLMRLSYTYEINSPSKVSIYNTILINNNVKEDDGVLFIDSRSDLIYQNVMQFIGCIQKISNMRHFGREVVQSLFFEDFGYFIETNLINYNPVANFSPLQQKPFLEVDYKLEYNNKNIFIMGVNSSDRAKSATISLLEFQLAGIPFINFIVYEDMDSLSKKDQKYLTDKADKQFSTLAQFKDSGESFLKRLAN